MSGSRPSSVAVLGAFNVAELALIGKGLRSASLRRAGHLQHPKLFRKFRCFEKNSPFFVRCFVRKKVARYPRTLVKPQQQHSSSTTTAVASCGASCLLHLAH